jgi:hypothetical protein
MSAPSGLSMRADETRVAPSACCLFAPAGQLSRGWWHGVPSRLPHITSRCRKTTPEPSKENAATSCVISLYQLNLIDRRISSRSAPTQAGCVVFALALVLR